MQEADRLLAVVAAHGEGLALLEEGDDLAVDLGVPHSVDVAREVLTVLFARGGFGREDLQLIHGDPTDLREALLADERKGRFEVVGSSGSRHLEDSDRTARVRHRGDRHVLHLDLRAERAHRRC